MPIHIVLLQHASMLMNFLIISAIATVVTVAEILKNNGLAVEKSKDLYHICFCHCDSYLHLHLMRIVLQRS